MIPVESHALFRKCYETAQRIAITTHLNPDGDALGSEISLARFLRAHGKEVRVINGDPTSDTLTFVEQPPSTAEHYQPEVHDELLKAVDLVILVDNSAPDRLGRMERIMSEVADHTLCIDHHPMRSAPWVHKIVHAEFCATAAMIYELVRATGWEPDVEAALAIYVGIATDTGFFRFNSTNAHGHAVAAELLELGVDAAATYQQIHEHNSEAFTRLQGHALAGLRVVGEGAIAAVHLPADLIRSLGAEDVDSSEIATSLLAMEGIRIVALFRELPDGRVKVSLRSKGALDVHSLAIRFGGGGHRNASGIVLERPLEDVSRTVLEQAAGLIEAADAPERKTRRA